ncbi:MAG: hypothetical protein QXW82_07570 [Candidatus Bathyarchaeia archaeon]
MEFNTLKNKYEQQHRVLTEEYKKRKAILEGEIERLKRDSEAIRAAFERQGLSWDEGVAIVAEIASLREESERLKGEASMLKMEASRSQNKISQLKLNIQRLLEAEQKLQKSVSNLRWKCSSYMEWFKTEAPKLEQYKSQLQQSIKTLEDQKLKLTEEIAKLQQLKAQSQVSLKALEDEKARAVQEIDKLKSEVEDLAQRIVADAEEKRKRILHEIESLEKEREKIRAEKDLLECAVRDSLRQLQQARSNQTQAHKTPLENLIQGLPALNPLPGDKKAPHEMKFHSCENVRKGSVESFGVLNRLKARWQWKII